jgi:hypothetical protein
MPSGEEARSVAGFPRTRAVPGADGAQQRCGHAPAMTFAWFVVWLIANNVGAHEPLLIDPVNGWAGALILAVALDLSAAHARGRG